MIAQTLTPIAAKSRTADGAISVLDDIGNTPLLDLTRFAHSCGAPEHVELYAKAEWANPGGSVKARAAFKIVEEAEADGRLGTGQTLIDSSSGNTAIAYALVGAVRGFPVHLVMPKNVSRERKALVKAYGATLIESDPLEGSDGAIRLVREIVAADPDRYFYADQYNNDANWRAHYEGTGPEIWQQTQGRVTHFVAGLGTTGTFVGAGRFLREQSPATCLVAVQPEDELSVIEGLKYLPTAITPGIYVPSLVDRHMTVAAETAWDVTQALARSAGLFVGFSSGAAVAAAVQLARELPLNSEGVVVTLLPDDGSKYVSLGLFD
ncbi:MAG: PLP-dependent cysteine synthase family protein [Caldilineaceae bacterium SB0661_bin_32]|uniref:PLP-dependent cysteine synthase family protein n=1 Tax=Caldilineaceae bacterium SB0661_bin_32 TaxID=2605255 RepID=A0A6B1D9U8_9CHLR|nr:PLP-dependent cysteine synthase family protein [Caldilineaceae bacterium SB0661_bin_32]